MRIIHTIMLKIEECTNALITNNTKDNIARA
jgi:hypothetical protein